MADIFTPIQFDFTWVRGTTVPFRIGLMLNNVPVEFDDVRMTISAGKKLLWRMSIVEGGGEVTDPGNAQVTFTPTAEQTRLLVESKVGDIGKNNYEVEVRNGASEVVYALGTIAGIGGRNDDEGDEVS